MLRCARTGCLAGLIWLAGTIVAEAAPWAELASDLPQDPTLRSGTLRNGLRYVVRPNAEPKGHVSIRLLVAAGSLVERDDERGLAHFVEHMAFRGTRTYPGNSLTTLLERRGIGLGPDNTAFTSYDYTVYHLELSDTKPETLRLGLGVFKEYADGVTFEPEAIERERGVVLSEMDTRNTPDSRISDSLLGALWPESRQMRRLTIGTESCIRNFTREQFVAFYDAWYRPERLAIIIVGDIDPAAVEPLIGEIFGSLMARGPPREEPADIVPATAALPNVELYQEDTLAGVRLYFTHPQPRMRPPDTHAERVRALHRSLAFAMFGRRLIWGAQRKNAAYVAPTVTTDIYIPGWETISFSAAGRLDSWPRTAMELEQEHRRAYQFGFTPEELQFAKEKLANDFVHEVSGWPTQRSEFLVGQIAGTLLYGGALVTPETRQRDLKDDIAAATLRECVDAFRAAWSTNPPHVLLTTNRGFRASTRQLRDVLNASRQQPVKAPPAAKAVTFAYTSFGPPGQLVAHDYLADLDAHLSRFGNGVRLNFKSTPFEADTINLVVRVGSGRLSRPANQPGLEWLASFGFLSGGLGRHSSEELDNLLSRRVFSIQFGIEPDACVFYARCSRSDLSLTLQVITAYLTDAAYRPEAIGQVRAGLGSMYSNFDAVAGGVISFHAERVMTAGNALVGWPQPAEAYARTFPELSRWLGPQLKRGAIEMSVVGDVTWSEAADSVAQTLGALGKRDEVMKPADKPLVTFSKPSPSPRMFQLGPLLRQAALAWYWPVPDLADVHRERRCRLLASVLREILFARLREELGVTYAPTAEFIQYDGLPSFSYFTLRAEVRDQGPKAAQVIRRAIQELLDKGIDEDVFLRARQPFLRSREEDLRNNAYWGHTVLRDAQQRPERLVAARDRTADTAAITRGELELLARQYLSPAQGFVFIAEPGPTTVWGPKYTEDGK